MPELRKEWLLHNLALWVGSGTGLLHQLKENDEVLGILTDRGLNRTEIDAIEESLRRIAASLYPGSPGISRPSLSES